MTNDFRVGPPTAPDTFHLATMLGSGGEGEVWRGTLPLSAEGKRAVAVKIVPVDDDIDPSAFDRYAHLLRSLSHPGLVRVTDVFVGAGMHRAGAQGSHRYLYVVMDHVEGTTLRAWMDENPDATVAERLPLLHTVASALDTMHSGATTEVPVSHGDVKPANIIVRPDRSTMLVDLGLARLADGDGAGGFSPPYAAPEVRVGGVPTPDADRFAFIATVAQTLLGRTLPLDDDGWLDLDALRSALLAEPRTAGRHELVGAILDALAAAPEDRPRSLSDWLTGTVEALSVLVPAEPLLTEVPTIVAPPQVASPEPEPTTDPAPIPAPVPVADTEPPTADRRRRAMIMAAAGVASVALLVVSLLVATAGHDGPAASESVARPGGEIFLEPATTPGTDPFTGSVSIGERPLDGQQAAGGDGSGNATVRGDSPGLYGGTRDNGSCDPAKLVSFLQNDEAKGRAWASALGIQPDQIAAYVAVLTPVVLRADTRVTNHGFRDGIATTLQSTFQAGTAVMVDQFGVPRVRCGCGNPLAEPVPQPAGVHVGAGWAGSDRAPVVVQKSTTTLDRFVLVDTTTNQPFTRPIGTNGQADYTDPAPTTVAPPPHVAPRTTIVVPLPPTAPPPVILTTPPTVEPPPTSSRTRTPRPCTAEDERKRCRSSTPEVTAELG
ncbi:MAG: serine/threonine protein kinase [Pseudonocardiaceae bacterium]|nr:MAG: serine/threonine protein kinase [Pseudonocardiaceae bacterium]